MGEWKRGPAWRAGVAVLALAGGMVACGGGGDGGAAGGGSGSVGTGTAVDCGNDCGDDRLSAADVERVLAQTVQAAQSRGLRATVAVTDRVGNVLGVYAMDGAAATFRIDGGRGVSGGLEGVDVLPSAFAAISKAITGAYLSSAGHAFSTRTASQIVQEHFNPREANQVSGPLSGVQFSQLSCSDLVLRATDAQAGPKRAPLGLSADPGGLPLYRNGRVVGGIGVMADGVYGLDLDITNLDADVDETLAVAGSAGYVAPEAVRANRITVDGRSLRFTDAALPGAATGNGSLTGLPGALVAVPGYFDGTLHAGAAFGEAASGVRRDDGVFADLGGWRLVDAAGIPRYEPRDGTEAGGGLTAAEVQRILREALVVASRARAQIRAPAGQAAQVTITVVDSAGVVLGLVRTPDAPIFGSDVALQKARSASFFSLPQAGSLLQALPDANYLSPSARSAIGAYVQGLRSFAGDGTLLANGLAFSSRAIGNLARPFFPDGVESAPAGPLSKPYAQWSPFSTGLQLDLAHDAIVAAALGSTATGCTGLPQLVNGLQIFPGGSPIYRTVAGVPRLVGGVGVSGDGIDQDDMIGFLGVARAGSALGNGLGPAPAALRADALVLPGGRLRYVQCPQSPFNGSNEQNVCEGL